MQKYKIVSILGDGAFGTVYKAVNNKTNEVVAIKKMKSKYKNWEECLQLRQIKSLRKLSHPNIIKMKEVLLVSEELHLVFQYLETNLYEEYSNRKKAGKSFSQKQIKNMLFQLASALAHMHKNGFFHRDLKPQNILIAGDILKICDFGLARQIRSRPPFTDYVSTRWYRSPQLLLRSTNYNSPVDVFAFGCIASQLYNLCPLFPGDNDIDQLNRIVKVLGTPQVGQWPQGYKLAKALCIDQNIKAYSFPIEKGINLLDLIPNISFQALDLIKGTLKYSSRRRITMSQILKHNYFQGVSMICEQKQKQIFFEEKHQGKILDSSKHEKQLQQFRMTKNKFRQTRRHNALQSDPFKNLQKHQQQPSRNPFYSNREDPGQQIDDIIKQLEEKKKKEKSSKEIGLKYPTKVTREKFYTEVQSRLDNQKEFSPFGKYPIKGEKIYKQEQKKYNSNNYESGFKKQGKPNIFSYGFQPASFPSLIPNSLERNHYSVTPVLNTKNKGINISANNYQKEPLNKPKGLFSIITPFRY